MIGDWAVKSRHAVEALGPPLYSVAEPAASRPKVAGYGFLRPRWVTLRHETPAGRVEITNGRVPLGGTRNLVDKVIAAALPFPRLRLPINLSINERLAMVTIETTRAQFRVVYASTGHWFAAGGLDKRHLLLSGPPRLDVEDIALRLTSLDDVLWDFTSAG